MTKVDPKKQRDKEGSQKVGYLPWSRGPNSSQKEDGLALCPPGSTRGRPVPWMAEVMPVALGGSQNENTEHPDRIISWVSNMYIYKLKLYLLNIYK